MKNFFTNLFFYAVKLPSMVVILFMKNTWKIWLFGGIILLLIFLSLFTENYRILLVTLTVISAIPLYFNTKKLVNLTKIKKNGVKTTGTIWFVQREMRNSPGYVKVHFTDENGTEYAPEINNRLIFPSMAVNREISVTYDRNNPENACFPTESTIENIIAILLSICVFLPFLMMLKL